MGGLVQPQRRMRKGCPLTICFSSGCARYMYDSSMLARQAKRLSYRVLSRGYLVTTIRRWHHVFHDRLDGGCKEPIYTTRPLCRFLWLTNKSCQISFRGFQTNPRREFAVLRGLRNVDRDHTYVIFQPALDEGQNVENRLNSHD